MADYWLEFILQIKELIDLYLSSLEKEKNLSLQTIRGYKNDLNFFEKWLTENKITEINMERINHEKTGYLHGVARRV